MNFLFDEMIPRELTRVLKVRGHEGLLLSDLHQQGISNGSVVQLAAQMKAIIITCDSDFLSLKKSLQLNGRIIYVKIHPRHPPVILKVIEKNLDFCIEQLKKPGKVILTESTREYKSP